jgi:hypothetical protein
MLGLFKVSYGQNSPEQISNKFFDTYKKEGFDKGLDYLFSTNKYSADYKDGLVNVKQEVDNTIAKIGQFYGYELISSKAAGKSILLLTYIVKYEKDALTFRILFYKALNDWQVQTFKFDNKIGDELEVASKEYKE